MPQLHKQQTTIEREHQDKERESNQEKDHFICCFECFSFVCQAVFVRVTVRVLLLLLEIMLLKTNEENQKKKLTMSSSSTTTKQKKTKISQVKNEQRKAATTRTTSNFLTLMVPFLIILQFVMNGYSNYIQQQNGVYRYGKYDDSNTTTMKINTDNNIEEDLINQPSIVVNNNNNNNNNNENGDGLNSINVDVVDDGTGTIQEKRKEKEEDEDEKVNVDISQTENITTTQVISQGRMDKKLLQQQQNNNNNIKNKPYSGLTLWTTTNIEEFTSDKHPNPTSFFILTRMATEPIMYERIPVHFQICQNEPHQQGQQQQSSSDMADSSSSSSLSLPLSFSSCVDINGKEYMMTPIEEILSSDKDERNEYNYHKNSRYVLFTNRTGTNGGNNNNNTNVTDSKRLTMDFPFVTYWSTRLRRHIPLDVSTNSLNFARKNCKGNECPTFCDNRSNEEVKTKLVPPSILLYPSQFDPIDHICKSTDPRAVPPKRSFGGPCTCATTCYTEQAGKVNSTWPWKSKKQRERFYPSHDESTPTMRKRLRLQRQDAKKKRRGQRYEARFVCHKNDVGDDYSKNQQKRRRGMANGILKPLLKPTSAATTNKNINKKKIFTLPKEAYGDFLHHLFFFPEAKLIFCGIPKVGITEWIKFLRFTYGAKDYLSLPHYKSDKAEFTINSLSMSMAEELFNDPTWTKAVFFRNPAERLVSAYNDKILRQGYTQTVFGIGSKSDPNRTTFSFEEFVNAVTKEIPSTIEHPEGPYGLHSRTDPHWKPQVMTCGLDYLLPHFDFIGSLDHSAEHTKLLLQKVGLWDDYGSKFDDGSDLQLSRKHMCSSPPPEELRRKQQQRRRQQQSKTNQPNIIFGFNQKGSPTKSGDHIHETNSQTKMKEYFFASNHQRYGGRSLLKNKNNKLNLLEQVREAYSLDYAIWDELQARMDINTTDIPSGKDFQIVKDFCS